MKQCHSALTTSAARSQALNLFIEVDDEGSFSCLINSKDVHLELHSCER